MEENILLFRVEVSEGIVCFHFPLMLLLLGMKISLVGNTPSAKILEGEMHEADTNLTSSLEPSPTEPQLSYKYDINVCHEATKILYLFVT